METFTLPHTFTAPAVITHINGQLLAQRIPVQPGDTIDLRQVIRDAEIVSLSWLEGELV